MMSRSFNREFLLSVGARDDLAGARLWRHGQRVVPWASGGVGRRFFGLELQRHPRHRLWHGDRLGDSVVRWSSRPWSHLHGRLGRRALPLPGAVDGPFAGGSNRPLVRAPSARRKRDAVDFERGRLAATRIRHRIPEQHPAQSDSGTLKRLNTGIFQQCLKIWIKLIIIINCAAFNWFASLPQK